MKLGKGYAEVFSFLLYFTTTTIAQEWHWQRDDLVLNPSGLDLSNVASWAWGDVDCDGYVDVLIREDHRAGSGPLVCYRGGAFPEPPYWIVAPELIDGLGEPEFSYGISVADLDGDGKLNLVTRVYADARWLLLSWKKNALGKWVADSIALDNVDLEEHPHNNRDPFFVDVDTDGDLDMLLSTPAPIHSVGIRFFENTGTAQEAKFREDSTRLALVYQNPVGLTTWSATIMYADEDSLLDLIVASDSEGWFELACYPGVMDSAGLR